MSVIDNLVASFQFNRTRTLALLEKIEQEGNVQEVLGWRPGPGRAHIGWQLLHIGVTEELIATERLDRETPPRFSDLIPRFKGGSTPDDDIPPAALIRQVLTQSRERMIQTCKEFNDTQLGWISNNLQARKLTLHDILHIVAWHEPHHQGQAHLTFNLYKARQAS